MRTQSNPDALNPSEASPSRSLAECDTQLIIAQSLGYGTYTKALKANIMSLTMGIRAYAKTLGD